MKRKITMRNIKASRTTDPELIARMIKEAEGITLPDTLYNTAADIAASVKANIPGKDDWQAPAIIASYILRYAYILSKAGELVESPQNKDREGGGK